MFPAAWTPSPAPHQPLWALLPMCPLPMTAGDSLLAQNKGLPLSPSPALLPPHPRHPRCRLADATCWMLGKAQHRCSQDGTSGSRFASNWWELGHHDMQRHLREAGWLWVASWCHHLSVAKTCLMISLHWGGKGPKPDCIPNSSITLASYTFPLMKPGALTPYYALNPSTSLYHTLTATAWDRSPPSLT